MKYIIAILCVFIIAGWRGYELAYTEPYMYAVDTERRLIAGYGITSDNKWKAICWRFEQGGWTGYTLFDPLLMSKSEATCTDGKRVGGYIFNIQGRINAVIWDNPPAQSFINLHPAGYNHSRLNAMNDIYQVGFVITSQGKYRAALWNNTKESFIDLHQFLPAEFTESTALAISSDNKRIVGFASSQSLYKPVVWTAE